MRNLQLTHEEIEQIITALEINRDNLYQLADEALKLNQIEAAKLLRCRAKEIHEVISKILNSEKDV